MRGLAWLMLVAGCSGGNDEGTDSADTDTDGADDTDLAPSSFQAVLRVLGFEVTPGVFSASASADFYRKPQPFQEGFGTSIGIDTCEVTLYSGTSPTPPTETTPTDDRPGAGIVSADIGGDPVMFQNGNAGLDTWPAGQTVSFSASGGEVPAFDVPALLVLPEQPVSVTSERTPSGLTLRWTPATASDGPVKIVISGSVGVVECSAADDGEFLVTRAELDDVDPGEQYIVGREILVIESLPQVTVTGWAFVTVYAD